MKKYLFIVLLVGVCFAQLSVKSKHDLEPFKIKGGLTTTTSMQWKNGEVFSEKFESEIEYLVTGEWHCENDRYCILNISWIKDNIADTSKVEKEVVLSKSTLKNTGLDNPFFESFYNSKVNNEEKVDGSILISDIDGFIKAIKDVSGYSFGVNDTEVEYILKTGKIHKKKNEELKIYGSQGNELPVKLPENFIEEIIKWNDNKPIKKKWSLYLDKIIPDSDNCDSNIYNGFAIIDIKDGIDKIPYKNPFSITVLRKVVNNLFKSGASGIIFFSNMPNIDVWYKQIEKDYTNIFKSMNKGKIVVEFCTEVKDINLLKQKSFPLPLIIDTKDVELKVDDLDWMSQFLPREIPDWISSIESEQERNEMINMMGVGVAFDKTKSPFYNKIVLFGYK